MSNRLIVVANRLPLTLRRSNENWTTERSSGGLASAMKPLLQRSGGDWIGWAGNGRDGDHGDEKRWAVLQDWARTEHCFAIDLPAEVATRFYEGYANQTLWPVFHNLPSQLKFDVAGWQAYIEANRIFCTAVVERYQPGEAPLLIPKGRDYATRAQRSGDLWQPKRFTSPRALGGAVRRRS